MEYRNQKNPLEVVCGQKQPSCLSDYSKDANIALTYLSGTVLSPLQTYLIFTPGVGGLYYCPHFSDEKTGPQRGEALRSPSWWQSQDWIQAASGPRDMLSVVPWYCLPHGSDVKLFLKIHTPLPHCRFPISLCTESHILHMSSGWFSPLWGHSVHLQVRKLRLEGARDLSSS